MEAVNVCGCCLRIINSNKGLTEAHTRPGRGAPGEHAAMLADCFAIHLILVNEYECGICEECVGRLSDASEFKRQVQRSQAELLERLERALLVNAPAPLPPELAAGGALREEAALLECLLPNEDEPEAKPELSSEEETGFEMCQEAPEVKSEMPSEEDEAADETRRNHEQPAALWEMFDDDGTNIEAMLRERRRTCGGGPLLKAETCACAEDAGTSDDIHPLSARARQQLAMTCVVRLERLRQSQCQPCHVATDHEASLTTHMKDMHTDSAGLRAEEEACTCDTCGEHFADKMVSCKMCSKVLSSKYNFKRHGAVHTGWKPYSCDICNKCFTHKGNLTKHRRIHSGQKPYQCEICNKQFSETGGLNKHIRIHTGQKPYKCEICNKQFSESGSLNKHIRIHTGQKPYKCEICNKQFSQTSTLNSHMRIHTGQKPYKCNICNKQFTQKSNLKSHMIIHTGQKPYKCEICNKQFTRNSDMKKHIGIHTGQKPYKCEICNKRFTQNSTLQTHIRAHAGQKP